MKNLKITLVAFALFVAGTASAQDLTSINAKFAEAAEALNAKNFAVAIPAFEQVIDEGLDIEGAEGLVTGAKQHLPNAHFRFGGANFQAGKLDEALASFSKAAELAELYGNAVVLTNARKWIGQTVLKQGADAFNTKDYATAAVIFQKGYDANPNDTALAMNLAMSYAGISNYAKANEIYSTVIALGDEDSRFAEVAATAKQRFVEDNLVRASELAKAEDFAAAIAVADEILLVVPADATANMFRLQAYNNAKDYAKVVETGDVAVEAQTTDELRSAANYLVGIAHQNRQNWAKAIEYMRKVTVGPNVEAAKAQIVELQKAL